MPGVNKPTDGVEALARILRGYARRLEDLERKTRKAKRPKDEEIAPFSAAGAISVTTAGDEPQWKVQRGGHIVNVEVSLKTAGSSSTVVTFYLNGGSMGTVTLASSDTDETAYLGAYRAKPGDKIGARITTAGTGAKGLSAFVRMKG